MINYKLIAPCGMNCNICKAHLRKENKCPGCNSSSANMPKYCVHCIIRNCSQIQGNRSGFCFERQKFPCARLKQLDKRYQTKYDMSMIDNLENIKASGIREFVKTEKVRWVCPKCGGIICVHTGSCFSCGEA